MSKAQAALTWTGWFTHFMRLRFTGPRGKFRSVERYTKREDVSPAVMMYRFAFHKIKHVASRDGIEELLKRLLLQLHAVMVPEMYSPHFLASSSFVWEGR